MSREELGKLVKGIKAGDYVTAFGVDTRGAEVTREGTLLAPPKYMKGTRNGAKQDAIRVCVGLEGTDPEARSTWTTLFLDHGTLNRTKPPQPGDWTNGPLKDIPGMRVNAPMPVLFGGKGGKRTAEPTEGERAEIVHVGSGSYSIRSLESGDELFSGAWNAQVWWSVAPKDNEHQEHDEPSSGTSLGKPVYHVETGALVGYWTPDKFTPVDEV
jgi:hypothetical protein